MAAVDIEQIAKVCIIHFFPFGCMHINEMKKMKDYFEFSINKTATISSFIRRVGFQGAQMKLYALCAIRYTKCFHPFFFVQCIFLGARFCWLITKMAHALCTLDIYCEAQTEMEEQIEPKGTFVVKTKFISSSVFQCIMIRALFTRYWHCTTHSNVFKPFSLLTDVIINSRTVWIITKIFQSFKNYNVWKIVSSVFSNISLAEQTEIRYTERKTNEKKEQHLNNKSQTNSFNVTYSRIFCCLHACTFCSVCIPSTPHLCYDLYQHIQSEEYELCCWPDGTNNMVLNAMISLQLVVVVGRGERNRSDSWHWNVILQNQRASVGSTLHSKLYSNSAQFISNEMNNADKDKIFDDRRIFVRGKKKWYEEKQKRRGFGSYCCYIQSVTYTDARAMIALKLH